jgi:ATP-binding cassette subfamily B multidrug efflux pump
VNAELNQEGELQYRAFEPRLMWRLLVYMKPYLGRVCAALLLIVVAAAASQVGPRLTQVAIDDHVIAGDLDGLTWIIALFFGSIVLQYCVQYGQTIVTEVTGQLVMRDLRRQIFAHLQRLPLRYFDRTPIGRIMTRTTNDVEALNEFFTEGVVSVFMDIFTLIAIVGFMAHMDIKLTLVSCVVVPVLFVTTFYLQGLAMSAYRELRTRLARLNSFLQENISGMEVVQLFNRQTQNALDFDGEHIPYRKAEDREIRYYAIFFPLSEFIGTVGMALIVWYGSLSVLNASIELGVLVAFLQYIRRFFRPIMDINDRYALLQSAMAASERIFELLDLEPEPEGGVKGAPAPTLKGVIEFQHVSFRYNDEAKGLVLKDVSFRVEAGQSLALVGATGSGKTTIVNLLCRFYEIQAGRILVNGRDIVEWNVEELRQRISIVQQDVFLFSGDIAGNISLGGQATGTLAEEAAGYVNARRFIDRLPGGMKHPVAEGGSTLSAGERQLLSFARAVAFQPEFLVLDEATSSIDTETEHLVQEAIARLMKERTSIVIAHRLSTIRNADQILVMHKGEIRERGRHEELISQRGIYARLYQLHYDPEQQKSD